MKANVQALLKAKHWHFLFYFISTI